MKFSPEKIKEIAEEIELGNRCYVHRKTGEILILPEGDYDEMVAMVGEDCVSKEDYDKLENSSENYCQIEKMPSHKAFKVMEKFAEKANLPRALKAQLLLALDKRKPFQQFKHIVEGSDFREDWFAFREKKIGKYVMKEMGVLGDN